MGMFVLKISGIQRGFINEFNSRIKDSQFIVFA